jgi:hypothetical protein
VASPRDNLRAFGDLVGRRITDWQAQALSLVAAITIVIAGRGMGKTRTLALFAVWEAFRHAGFKVLVVSASEASARRLLAEVREVVGAEALRGSVVDLQAGLVTLSNGSEIRSVPSSEKAVRGSHVDLLLVDEAAFVSDELLLGAAFPTTAARDGKIVLASSAGVAAGAFYDQAAQGLAGSKMIRAYKWVAKAADPGGVDAPWMTPSLIARERAALGPLRFAAEFLAQFATGADSLFSAAMLDKVTVDYSIPDLAHLVGPARVMGGVDWGAVNDRSALVAIGRLPIDADERVFAVRCVERWDAGAPIPDVVDQMAASPAAFDWLTSETNGLGAASTQILFRAMMGRRPQVGGGRRRQGLAGTPMASGPPRRQPPMRERPREPSFSTRKVSLFNTTASKAAMYSTMRLLFDRQRLLIPASAEHLRRELLMTKATLTESGGEKIEAATGHDDLADALGAALGPFKLRSDSQWRTRIGELASSSRGIPGDVVDLGTFADLVETGGGRLVPIRPAWASVAGPELSGEPVVAAPPPPLTPAAVAGRTALADALAQIHEQREGSE